MARKSVLAVDRFTFKLYKCTLPTGELYCARFFEKGNPVVLAGRSTGESSETRATAAAAGKLLGQLLLDKLARAKASVDQNGFEAAERMRNMDLASFFTQFWTPSASDYLRDREDAEKPLSNYYILCQLRYIAKHAATYQPFKKTPLRQASLYLIEQWMHHLKREKVSANVWTSPNLVEGQLSHSAKHLCRNHHGIRRVPAKPIIIDLDIFEKLCPYNGSRAATVKAV